MPFQKLFGIVFIGHGAFVVLQLILGFSEIKQSAESFAAPNDPFLILFGLVSFNSLLAVSALVLGAYFMQAKESRLIVVSPLAIVAALYGGYSLALGASALCLCLFSSYFRREI